MSNDNYVFFSSHNASAYKIDKDRHVFSQWYTGSPFIGKPNAVYDTSSVILDEHTVLYNNVKFKCREQFMMCMKALLFAKDDFKDHNVNIFKQILLTDDQRQMKNLGRSVANFDEQVWQIWGYKLVVNGNYLQFSQNNKLKEILINTGDKTIVEASSKDRIWGIGYSEYIALTVDKTKWGLNNLGKALMEIRGLLKN